MPDDGMNSAPAAGSAPAASGPTDAVSVMQATISEFSQGSEPSPAPAQTPTPTPEPTPPAVTPDPTVTDPTQPPVAEASEPNWYDAMFAEPEDSPDDLTTLLNEEAFNGLRENPQGLLDWATKARGHLQRFGESAEQQRTLTEGVERVGGWETAPKAFDIYGDLFRGELPLEAEDAEHPGAKTYVDRALMRILNADKQTAYSLGAAILNRMPDLLTHNKDYLFRVMGLDPKYADDYQRVVENGGFHIQEDQAAINKWFQDHGVPMDQLGTLRRLPLKVQQDILAGDPEAAKFHLQRYHNDFANEERTAKAEAERATAEKTRMEHQSARTLATEKDTVFSEYVKKGKASGLNDLEAAGLAAMAYASIEEQFWDDKSDVRRTIDNWHGYIKGGNKLQSDSGRSAYRKAFEEAYRAAAGRYKPQRAGVPPTQPKQGQNGTQNGNPPNGNQPQFPAQPSPDDKYKGLTGEALMLQIMRDQGAVV